MRRHLRAGRAAALLTGLCLGLGTAVAATPACGPDALGTSRTLVLPRAAATYGRMQHAPLPLAPREVVITFDDGPHAPQTSAVLDALAAECVRATFLASGVPLLREPALARRIVAEGHGVGLHGHTHAHAAAQTPAEQLAELQAALGAYQQVLGGKPASWRFPFLEETTPLREALADARITVLSADLGIRDWEPAPTPEGLVDRLMQGLAREGGGLLVMHDPQPQTAQALPAMLRAMKRAGYRVVHLAFDDQPGITLNQLGFLPGGAKWAAVPPGEATTFEVIDHLTGRSAHRGALGPAQVWPASGQAVRLADFSALTQPGRYRLRVAGQHDSLPFEIADGAYAALNAAALKAFYFNRASTALAPEHAGPWARPAGHADDDVVVHASAAGPGRPAGARIAAPKGWYDAGDYNKYIVNSGISVYTLLAAHEHFPAQFARQHLGIPESGNGLPDLLDEVRWNLDWMLAMQDPADGGVYHKLTNLGFDGTVMPHQATGARYVVQKGTAATLDFAAVMAMAARVYRPHEPAFAARLLAAAHTAWGWAQQHPAVAYRQPADVHTGGYDDNQFADEFAWAAAELYITTRDDRFWAAMKPEAAPMDLPGWSQVGGLAWLSLAHHRDQLTPAADRALITRRVGQLASELAAQWQASSQGVALRAGDHVWGSNAVALNQALVLVGGHRLTGSPAMLHAAQAALDHVLGRNPLGLSMVTGFGERRARHPHHRPSEADGVAEAVPGWLVGGPQPGQQDAKGCPVPYPSSAPALSYIDHYCSYAANEVAINWNAPLVYLSAALQALTPLPAKAP